MTTATGGRGVGPEERGGKGVGQMTGGVEAVTAGGTRWAQTAHCVQGPAWAGKDDPVGHNIW